MTELHELQKGDDLLVRFAHHGEVREYRTTITQVEPDIDQEGYVTYIFEGDTNGALSVKMPKQKVTTVIERPVEKADKKKKD